MKSGVASTLLLVAVGLATFVASQNSTSADPEINSSVSSLPGECNKLAAA